MDEAKSAREAQKERRRSKRPLSLFSFRNHQDKGHFLKWAIDVRKLSRGGGQKL